MFILTDGCHQLGLAPVQLLQPCQCGLVGIEQRVSWTTSQLGHHSSPNRIYSAYFTLWYLYFSGLVAVASHIRPGYF